MLKYPIFVTIDTNIFDAAKYDFSENSTLQILASYVKKRKIKVVLSDIVIREAKKHIGKQVEKVCGAARRIRAEALKESTEYLINYVGLSQLLELVSNKKALVDKSEEIFDKFINDIDAEILHMDLVDLDAIIDDYFEIRPPFEAGEKKRKEFPDAFIAYQIRKRFGENGIVAIISSDDGFKDACQQTSNHIFFNSLGELYDTINKEEAEYNKTMDIIRELQSSISSKVLAYIKSNENIDVKGISFDKDGIISGFEYDEFYLYDLSDISFEVHSIDKMSHETSVVTLLCTGSIFVDCYYTDYENAPWDSETKEYVFADIIKIREEHNARFACRIELNRVTRAFDIFPFAVILGGDSRKDRYQIKD